MKINKNKWNIILAVTKVIHTIFSCTLDHYSSMFKIPVPIFIFINFITWLRSIHIMVVYMTEFILSLQIFSIYTSHLSYLMDYDSKNIIANELWINKLSFEN